MHFEYHHTLVREIAWYKKGREGKRLCKETDAVVFTTQSGLTLHPLGAQKPLIYCVCLDLWEFY